jgi:hypothetical protein|tara:strand:- start:14058 stop:14513 length:456 start_codon:yes stop_codon:yes gene_type:complete
MIAIAHRGNLDGRNPERENSLSYIQEALDRGYHAEIDLRMEDGKMYLGHEMRPHESSYPVSPSWLVNRNKHLWVHCKDIESLQEALNLRLNCFWHQRDLYTLTSRKWIWALPGSPTPKYHSIICVLPELNNQDINNFTGFCSDYVLKYEKN